MKHLTLEELGVGDFTPEQVKILAGWLRRGDGIAVYQNEDFGHPQLGDRKYVSFGSNEALLETDKPPTRLPDFGGQINWRYILVGVYTGPPFVDDTIHFGTLQPDGTLTNERKIKQSDIQACPHLIMMPEHYREDGSCRCNDPDHTQMSEWGYRWDDNEWEWVA